MQQLPRSGLLGHPGDSSYPINAWIRTEIKFALLVHRGVARIAASLELRSHEGERRKLVFE
jgi:hypothetical protein